jgi:hypothetical protein
VADILARVLWVYFAAGCRESLASVEQVSLAKQSSFAKGCGVGVRSRLPEQAPTKQNRGDFAHVIRSHK